MTLLARLSDLAVWKQELVSRPERTWVRAAAAVFEPTEDPYEFRLPAWQRRQDFALRWPGKVTDCLHLRRDVIRIF
jgi:hypothetical protein